MLALSTFVFGFSNVMAKYLTHSYPIGEALLIRSGVALLLLTPFMRPVDVVLALRSDPWAHLLRMIVTAAEINCFYWAVSVLQLADVTTFYLSTPIVLTAIAATVLREKVDPLRWVATCLGFVGVLIALRPSAGALAWPALVALAGSTLYSVFLALSRRLRRTPGKVMVFLQLASLAVAGGATVPFAWTTPSLDGLALMATVGLIGFLGYILVNRALQLAPASVVAPFQYLSIIWSIALGYLTFGDVPSATTLGGAALIIAAGAVILLLERRAGQP
jgi:drug/metabolite transporter (DMT)-like permease